MSEPALTPQTAAKLSQLEARSAKRRHLLFYIWLAILTGLVFLIFISRYQADDRDHASANLTTYVSCVLIWTTTLLFLLLARLWKSSVTVALVPLLATLAFLLLYRLDRVDGDLRPHFVRRWSNAPVLPTVLATTKTASDPTVDPDLFQPGPGDWSQFLGPTRNANARGFSIDHDWKNHPPMLLWRQSIGEGWSGFAVRGQVAITMEQRDEQEWVSAYNVQSGSLLWRYVIQARHSDPLGGPGPRSTPTIDEDKVFACSAVSQVVCLQLSDGKEVWKQELNSLAGVDQAQLLEEVDYGRSGSPLISNSCLIVPLGGSGSNANSLIAFDKHTGVELWRAGTKQISYASPMLVTLDGVEQILYPSKDDLLSCDPRTGQPLWTLCYEGVEEAPNVAQPIQLDDHVLFLSKGYGVGARLVDVRKSSVEVDASEQAWQVKVLIENRTVMRTKFTNPVYYEDHIYGLSDGILECIEARSLKRKWKGGRYRQGQLLLAEDCLLVSAEDGRVVLVGLNPQKHQELGELAVIGDVTWNPPTLVGDRLLVRNSRESACIQLKLKADQP